jgi:ATP-binding cassette subfamily B protein RaxB
VAGYDDTRPGWRRFVNAPSLRALFSGKRTLPVIRQSEYAECGLACLAMIASAHGHQLDLAAMRRRFGSSAVGNTLGTLIKTASALQLQARPLRVELAYLPQLRLPALLHWRMAHFVVLVRVTRKGIHIHDPGSGARFVPMSEVDQSFTGVAVEFTPAEGFEPVIDRQRISLWRLTGRIQGLAAGATQVLLLALMLELLTLSLPLAMQWILDGVLTTADTHLLTLLGIGCIFIVGFQALTQALRGVLVGAIGASLKAQWSGNLFGRLIHLPYAYFERREVGEIMSRFHSVQCIQQTLSVSFVDAMLDGLTVMLVLAVLALYSVPLTALVLAAVLVYGAVRWLAYRLSYRLNEERLGHEAKRQTLMLEAVRAVLSIKLAGAEGARRARVANATLEVASRDARVDGLGASVSAASRLVFGWLRIALLWLGAWMVLRGQFSVGAMVAFIAFADVFAQRASALVDHLAELRMLDLHAERIADIALQTPEQLADGAPGRPVASRPDLQVRGLSYRYQRDTPRVLDEISFDIRGGEHVAIVGASGCGKTTLAKLLLGLLEPESGSICIDGTDIRQFGIGRYRQLFGTVMQNDQLMSGSIADNISFFDPDADFEQVMAAARSAVIHDDILALPMGYETPVGDLGAALSGGQKQRLILARALYRKPAILLLDEATSHLDVNCERRINQQIAALAITRIVIAHRPETIAAADRVLEIIDGRIGGDGPAGRLARLHRSAAVERAENTTHLGAVMRHGPKPGGSDAGHCENLRSYP